jgi:hypothetical protein
MSLKAVSMVRVALHNSSMSLRSTFSGWEVAKDTYRWLKSFSGEPRWAQRRCVYMVLTWQIPDEWGSHVEEPLGDVQVLCKGVVSISWISDYFLLTGVVFIHASFQNSVACAQGVTWTATTYLTSSI